MLISKPVTVICKYSDAATLHPNPRSGQFAAKFQGGRESSEQLSSDRGPVGANSNLEDTVRKGYVAAPMQAETVKLPSASFGALDVWGGLKKIAAAFVSAFKRACAAIGGNSETRSDRVQREFWAKAANAQLRNRAPAGSPRQAPAITRNAGDAAAAQRTPLAATGFSAKQAVQLRCVDAFIKHAPAPGTASPAAIGNVDRKAAGTGKQANPQSGLNRQKMLMRRDNCRTLIQKYGEAIKTERLRAQEITSALAKIRMLTVEIGKLNVDLRLA